jgi:alanyl-tRNA synthetase
MAGFQRLYYSDPRLTRAEATVLAVEGGSESPILVLDRALLFPGGGGQPADSGDVGGVAVAEASEAGGRAALRLAGPSSARAGDRVLVSVDARRRLDYAQQHTGEHLLAAAALRLFGFRSVSVHFGPERSLVDLDASSVTDAQLDAIEEEVDSLIARGLPVRVHLCPPEDPASFPLRRPAPAGEEEVRVVEVEGVDFTPCCGVHLGSTGELRALRLVGAEKYKGMTRVRFLAGARASADYRSVSRIARESARILGSSEEGLPEAVAREAQRRAAADRALGDLIRERAAAEAASALEAALASRASGGEAAAGSGGPLVALRRYEGRSAGSLMDTAKAFAEAGMTAVLASVPDLTVQAVAPELGPRLGERLKAALAASGGKGGGGSASFRAVFADAASLEAFMAAAAAELGR